MRYFFKPEIEEYLNETGFELKDILDNDMSCDVGLKTWTCYFAAEAR